MAAPGSIAVARVGPPWRPSGLADRVGQRLEVVGTRGRCLRLTLDEDDSPAARHGEPVGMSGTQVVRVRLGIRRQGSENGGGLRVCVRQRRDGCPRAGRPRAAPGLHFWHASWRGWPEPSPQGMCDIVSADLRRRTLVPCPTRPATPPVVQATQPTHRGTYPDDRLDRVRAAGADVTAGGGACADGWCRPSFRCT